MHDQPRSCILLRPIVMTNGAIMRFVVAIVVVLNIGLVAQAPDTLDLTQRGVKSESGTREDKPATGSGLGISSHATREPMRVALELADLDRGSYEDTDPFM